MLWKSFFLCEIDLFFLFSYDYMKIINDQNHAYGVYCGQKTGQSVLVSGDYAVIIFHSDETDQRKGFLLYFTAVPLGESIENHRDWFFRTKYI